jgi:hypothetical protein
MIQADIDRIKSYCEKATPGPWATHATLHMTPPELADLVMDGSSRGVDAKCLAERGGKPMLPAGFLFRNDAEFIAQARTDLPLALAEIERLQAELNEVRRDKVRLDKLQIVFALDSEDKEFDLRKAIDTDPEFAALLQAAAAETEKK